MSAFLTTDSNDLALEVGPSGKLRLVFSRDVVVCGAFKLSHRFQFFEGEWYLDTREGVPYFRIVFVKKPSLSAVRNMLRKVILSIPSIATVVSTTFTFDPATRECAFSFEAMATDGRKIVGGSGAPFIVGGRSLQDYARDQGASQ